MFENLTDRLSRAFKYLSGQSRFTEENTEQALREIKLALLDADVALAVINDFISQIKNKTIGQEVAKNLKPEQALVKIVNDELVHILGDVRAELNFKTQPPAVILLAGLQGCGKTTSAAKLALYLKEIEKKKVLLVSTDIYRPAAIEQLRILAQQIDIGFFETTAAEKPINIAKQALDYAKRQYVDVVIFDTAGRLHIDNEMMEEIRQLHQLLKPTETLFVIDSMTGQDAAHTTKTFNDALTLTGVILTKTDGDARGGAALSVKLISGKPIKFIGNGEKITALEPFHPERIASRILGMGDVLSLIEEVERKADKKSNDTLAKKLKQSKGRGFDLNDFREQLEQMNKMGGISSLMGKLPGVSALQQNTVGIGAEKSIGKMLAIINSMTMQERRNPKIIVGSRKKRIANGSGTDIPEVNRLLKQFATMQKMLSKFARPGALKQMMRGLGGMNIKGLFPGNFGKPE